MSVAGKPEFHEDFNSPKVDPLHVATVDFDYGEIDRRLCEEPIDQTAELKNCLPQEVADLLTVALGFGIDVPFRTPHTEKLIGRRFAALCWVINPGMFEGSPSATELAKRLGIKSAYHFHKLTGEAGRALGIKNRGQCHAWNNPRT